jgi:hypothetical protein
MSLTQKHAAEIINNAKKGGNESSSPHIKIQSQKGLQSIKSIPTNTILQEHDSLSLTKISEKEYKAFKPTTPVNQWAQD